MSTFLVTGKGEGRTGTPMVRHMLVDLVERRGHHVVTTAPRQTAPGHIDYLVASMKAIQARTAKVQWADNHGIPVMSYRDMWDHMRMNPERATPANRTSQPQPTPLPPPDQPRKRRIVAGR